MISPEVVSNFYFDGVVALSFVDYPKIAGGVRSSEGIVFSNGKGSNKVL